MTCWPDPLPTSSRLQTWPSSGVSADNIADLLLSAAWLNLCIGKAYLDSYLTDTVALPRMSMQFVHALHRSVLSNVCFSGNRYEPSYYEPIYGRSDDAHRLLWGKSVNGFAVQN